MTKLFIVSMKNDFGVSDQWFEWAQSVEDIEQNFLDNSVSDFSIEEVE